MIGPGDDAAVIEPERGALDVLTTDALVEGVHFDCRFVPPDAIGHRALAVNVSDLAAMGARPRAALLSLALPEALDVAFVDGMMDGMLALARSHRIAIVGGNITRSPGPLMIDVTAIGSVKRRRALARSGARPGDEVYVTGTIGDALVGLRSLQQGKIYCAVCQERYLRPEPRVRVGLLLGRSRAASACMDLSDGLADGIRQVAEASRVGMTIDAGAIPMSDETRYWHERHGTDPVAAAISGGDDYELLFTVRPSARGRLRAVLKDSRGVPITRIGLVTREPRIVLRTSQGERALPEGFEHFR